MCDLLAKAILYNSNLNDFFSASIATRTNTSMGQSEERNYGGNDYSEIIMCDVEDKVIYPVAGKGKDGKEQNIINSFGFRQGIRVALCLRPGKPCRMAEYFPNSFRSECQQQYATRELLSRSSNGRPVRQKFTIPSSCSCAIRRL